MIASVTTALDATADFLEWPLIVAATLGALAFIVLYTVLANWWQTKAGRHLFALTLGLFALGSLSILRRVVGEWEYYDVMVTVIYGVLAWELWRRVLLLFQAQLPHRKKTREKARENDHTAP